MPVLKYTKKPVTIEAIEWTGSNDSEVLGFINGDSITPVGYFIDHVL